MVINGHELLVAINDFLCVMVFLLIYRDERFSPGAVERDKVMLDKVAEHIANNTDNEIRIIHECDVVGIDAADYTGSTVVHMARSAEALAKLAEMQTFGARVLNPPAAIRNCSRANVERIMEANNLLTPKSLAELYADYANKGWWVKSNDTADSSPSHIQFYETLPSELASFSSKNKNDILVQPHIEGLNIKFYGVKGTDFFKVREYLADVSFQELKCATNVLAEALSLDIYGGDAILTSNGKLTIIDFNDFPSFSSCRDEASAAIVKLLWQRTADVR